MRGGIRLPSSRLECWSLACLRPEALAASQGDLVGAGTAGKDATRLSPT